MKIFFNIIYFIFYFSFRISFLLIITLVTILFIFSANLPDYKTLNVTDLQYVTKIYSTDYKLLNEYKGDEYRSHISLDKLKRYTINSFVVAEDKTFFTNKGIDVFGIIRSFFDNLTKNKILSGGSTITQQVIKNYLLSPEKSISRKIKEIILSIQVTNYISKNKIMELYLNKIYFGHNAYGIEAASLTYFNKSASELSIEESALLAAIPPSPTKLDPFRENNFVMKKRDWVLQRMQEENFISKEQYNLAVSKPILLHSSQSSYNYLESDFFTDEVKKQATKILEINNLDGKGFFITTTLSSYYQSIANQSLVHGLRKYQNTYYKINATNSLPDIDENNWLKPLSKTNDPINIRELELVIIIEKHKKNYTIGRKNGHKAQLITKDKFLQTGDVITALCNSTCTPQAIPSINGGIIVMEVNTGNILALSGGYDYKKSQFDVATQALRQPGSSFKPFVYLTALENNMTPRTLVSDDEIEIKQGDNSLPWRPKNYSNNFFGTITLRRALEVSQNTASVEIGRYAGIRNISKLARKFGLYDSPSMHHSVILGSKEVSLLKLVTAYASFANGGTKIKPNFIELIKNQEKKIILNNNYAKQTFANKTKDEKGLPLNITKIKIAKYTDIFQTADLMRGSVKRGTSRKVNKIKPEIAAKTGTSNDGVDHWFMGFWNNIAIGVYVGSDMPKTLGDNVSGAKIALPIFKEFIEKINDDKNFYVKQPSDLVYSYIDMTTGLEISRNTPKKQILLESFKKNTNLISNSDYNPLKLALYLRDLYDKKNKQTLSESHDYIMKDINVE